MGYEAVFQSVQGLVSDSKTVEQTLGFLISLALHNFSLSGIFDSLYGTDYAQVDTRMTDISPRLGLIVESGAIQVLWDLIPHLPGNDPALRYAIYKFVEVLLYLNHRNQVIFGSLGLVRSLFDLFIAHRNEKGVPSFDKERPILQKLLRRTLDISATTAESRLIFQKAVKEDDTLDIDVLEVIRAGMKGRWPEHFSMESAAALTLKEESVKGMPTTGFTFMVIKCSIKLSKFRLTSYPAM